MHGSRSKIPIKKSRDAALGEGFNSGLKELITPKTYYAMHIVGENCKTLLLYAINTNQL
jgi:hypothetical protein